MRTPEYRRIYGLQEFDPMWLGSCHTDDITLVYLPTTVMVRQPQQVVPFAARVYGTQFFELNEKLHHRNDFLGRKSQLPKDLKNRRSVVLCELWQTRDDNREHALKGYLFINELEFKGDPLFSVDYSRVSRSAEFKR